MLAIIQEIGVGKSIAYFISALAIISAVYVFISIIMALYVFGKACIEHDEDMLDW